MPKVCHSFSVHKKFASLKKCLTVQTEVFDQSWYEGERLPPWRFRRRVARRRWPDAAAYGTGETRRRNAHADGRIVREIYDALAALLPSLA